MSVRCASGGEENVADDHGSSCSRRRGATHSGSPRKRPRSPGGGTRSSSPDDSKFVVNFIVHGYKRGEISVKAFGECVEVCSKHEEESEDGYSYVKRESTKRFTLPEGVEAETVTGALPSSGVLAIEAP
ncbi:protein lethal(2)essential for life-like [Dermacentor variabilis]|uniref:protein lethal(2)essential for life-like n=1 Tax=Dermacentor variabilis TaxID=34621 RepID=UPI003F5AF682